MEISTKVSGEVSEDVSEGVLSEGKKEYHEIARAAITDTVYCQALPEKLMEAGWVIFDVSNHPSKDTAPRSLEGCTEAG